MYWFQCPTDGTKRKICFMHQCFILKKKLAKLKRCASRLRFGSNKFGPNQPTLVTSRPPCPRLHVSQEFFLLLPAPMSATMPATLSATMCNNLLADYPQQIKIQMQTSWVRRSTCQPRKKKKKIKNSFFIVGRHVSHHAGHHVQQHVSQEQTKIISNHVGYRVGHLVHLHVSHHVHLHVGRRVSNHVGHHNVVLTLCEGSETLIEWKSGIITNERTGRGRC